MQKQLLNNFKEDELIFLQNLLNTSSPSGNEYELVREVRLFLNGVCNLQTDSIGNLYIRSLNHTTSQIMITAHGDEVGFQITQIDTKGFCYMRRLTNNSRNCFVCVRKRSVSNWSYGENTSSYSEFK